MILNALEMALMNNPLRAAVQRGYEGRVLERLGGRMNGGVALEVGCGRGVGAGIILDRFAADRVEAFDLDPRMVELARARMADRGDRVRFWVGDAESIQAADATYEAVFEFGILHHVPDWRAALLEIRRVTKPGGTLYAEDVYAALISWKWSRKLLEHPDEGLFDHAGFTRAIRGSSFEILSETSLLGLFGFVAARAV
jgi:ubiquinone/menaquinone biosynthesis C-methylase UbiE